MYARAKLRFRLLPFAINSLFDWFQLPIVRNERQLRSEGQGGSAIPLGNSGIGKLHIVIVALRDVCYPLKSRHSRDIFLN